MSRDDERTLGERRIDASLTDAERSAHIFQCQEYLLVALRERVAKIEAAILDELHALPLEPTDGEGST